MAERDVVVKLDSRALDQLANTPQMGSAMAQAAGPGAAFVVREAPVKTGDYRDSITVEEVDVTVGGRTRRGARITASSEHGQMVEWANGTHLLARAVDAVERGR